MSNNPTSQAEFGSQIRKSPYFAATQRWGCTGYSVYNHMYIPRSFSDSQANFWNLVNDAILCDVASSVRSKSYAPMRHSLHNC